MRRMITEKEADKLRYLNDDDGSIALASGDANDDGTEIALDGDEITLRAAAVQFLNSDDHAYFMASPENGLYVMDLPTEDPHNQGCLWNDNGIVKISLG